MSNTSADVFLEERKIVLSLLHASLEISCSTGMSHRICSLVPRGILKSCFQRWKLTCVSLVLTKQKWGFCSEGVAVRWQRKESKSCCVQKNILLCCRLCAVGIAECFHCGSHSCQTCGCRSLGPALQVCTHFQENVFPFATNLFLLPVSKTSSISSRARCLNPMFMWLQSYSHDSRVFWLVISFAFWIPELCNLVFAYFSLGFNWVSIFELQGWVWVCVFSPKAK